jgi:hypothetical protein
MIFSNAISRRSLSEISAGCRLHIGINPVSRTGIFRMGHFLRV